MFLFVRKRPQPLKPSKSRDRLEAFTGAYWRLAKLPASITVLEKIKFWLDLGAPPKIQQRLVALQVKTKARLSV